jgi:hypothetical protein
MLAVRKLPTPAARCGRRKPYLTASSGATSSSPARSAGECAGRVEGEQADDRLKKQDRGYRPLPLFSSHAVVKMSRETLADIVFWFHVFWIGVLVCAIFLPPEFQVFHTIAASATIASQILWGGCPLVTLENALRENKNYTGSFTAYLFRKFFGIEVQPSVVTASLLFIFAISCYLSL